MKEVDIARVCLLGSNPNALDALIDKAHHPVGQEVTRRHLQHGRAQRLIAREPPLGPLQPHPQSLWVGLCVGAGLQQPAHAAVGLANGHTQVSLTQGCCGGNNLAIACRRPTHIEVHGSGPRGEPEGLSRHAIGWQAQREHRP